MNKANKLQDLKLQMEQDKTLPLINKPEDIIPGDGNPDAKILLIGEAGGYYESLERKPFVGAAGKLLTKTLEGIGINRKYVYITNMIKTRPPNNRDPQPSELAAYEKYLDEELKLIKPTLIVTLGRFSMAKFIPDAKITKVHGKLYQKEAAGMKVYVMPMFHPSAALRSGDVRKQFEYDFSRLPKAIEKIGSL